MLILANRFSYGQIQPGEGLLVLSQWEMEGASGFRRLLELAVVAIEQAAKG